MRAADDRIVCDARRRRATRVVGEVARGVEVALDRAARKHFRVPGDDAHEQQLPVARRRVRVEIAALGRDPCERR